MLLMYSKREVQIDGFFGREVISPIYGEESLEMENLVTGDKTYSLPLQSNNVYSVNYATHVLLYILCALWIYRNVVCLRHMTSLSWKSHFEHSVAAYTHFHLHPQTGTGESNILIIPYHKTKHKSPAIVKPPGRIHVRYKRCPHISRTLYIFPRQTVRRSSVPNLYLGDDEFSGRSHPFLSSLQGTCFWVYLNTPVLGSLHTCTYLHMLAKKGEFGIGLDGVSIMQLPL